MMLSQYEQRVKSTKMHTSIKKMMHASFVSFASFISCEIYAQQSISYMQAEQVVLNESFTTQANTALEQAAQLEAEAVKNIGLPRVDLNIRAYTLHKEIDVPLGTLKNHLDQSLIQGVDSKINQWQQGSGTNISGLQDDVNQGIHDGVGLIPNEYQVNLNDEVIRPTVSFMMPIYTGGLTTSAKEVANINAQRSQLNTRQQRDIQRFELIQAYFHVQLQKQLLASSQSNYNAMQKHYNNALKLERQGFISKGQRMQFEVAQNNAQRTYQNAETSYKASLFSLNNLLQSSNITALSTPLFINTTQNHSLNTLLKSFPEQSTLIQKLQKDTQLANANIKVQSAAKKPNIFAFGEYSLDDKQDWIVGIAARYNLFSGIDHQKKIKAAELQKYATELITARTQQEIENIIYKSYSEAFTAQQSDVLLQQNLKSAQENLRIQELSFKEDMGTATQVIDAQNSLSVLKAETALNAYKYIISLATLLQSHGSIDQFQSYINQPNTRYIR